MESMLSLHQMKSKTDIIHDIFHLYKDKMSISIECVLAGQGVEGNMTVSSSYFPQAGCPSTFISLHIFQGSQDEHTLLL